MRPKLRLDTAAAGEREQQQVFQFPLPPSSTTPTERMRIVLGPKRDLVARLLRKSPGPVPPLRRSKTFPPPQEEPTPPAPPLPSVPITFPDFTGHRSSESYSKQESRFDDDDGARSAPLGVATKVRTCCNRSSAPTGQSQDSATARASVWRSSTAPSPSSPSSALDSLVVELRQFFGAQAEDTTRNGSRRDSTSAQEQCSLDEDTEYPNP